MQRNRLVRGAIARVATTALLGAALWVVAGLTGALASVHAGDQLQVTVFNHPELSGRVTVDASGALSLPLAGNVNVAGLEPAQISARIERALDPYMKYPAVEVQLTTQTASLFVSGGPGGVLKYEPGETLAAALADLPDAAQVSPSAAPTSGSLIKLERSRIDLHKVGVTRNGKSLGDFDAVALSARGEGGPLLEPADTINLVNKPNAVTVRGDVARPGMAFLSKDEPLADAIDQAGGVTDSGATAYITLQRGAQQQTLALGDQTFHEPAQNGDLIDIPTAPRVSVVGMVDKPGPITLKTDFSLLNALYQAGGPTKWADLGHVDLMRDGKQASYNLAALGHGDTSQNIRLHDGDMIFVPEGHKIDFQPVFQTLLPFLYLFPRP